MRYALLAILVLCYLGPALSSNHLMFVEVGRPEVIAGRYLSCTGDFGPQGEAARMAGEVLAAQPGLACSPHSSQTGLSNKIVLIKRANCSFVSQVLWAQHRHAVGVIVYNTADSIGVMQQHNNDGASVTIPSVLVSLSAGQTFRDNIPVTVSVRPYNRPKLEPSAILLLLIAIATAIGAAHWSSAKERAGLNQTPLPPSVTEEQAEVQVLDERSAYAFIVVASLGLVTLFLFLSKLIYILIGVFALAGSQAVHDLVYSVAVDRVAVEWRELVRVPLLGHMSRLSLVLSVPSFAVGVWWIIVRNETYAWVLQDAMAVCLLLLIQKVLRLPNIKVSSILLVLAFFYDIFWVFLSPYFFRGKSVMTTVATGGDTGEAIPMVIRMPRFTDELGGYSLLGLGDVALPGLLLSFLLRYDYNKRRTDWSGYFRVVAVGYCVGLILTDVALFLTETGQPALLYIVPCTLGVVVPLAWYRGDLDELWKGTSAPSDDHRHSSSEERAEGRALLDDADTTHLQDSEDAIELTHTEL